jgi:hypothetical protein
MKTLFLLSMVVLFGASCQKDTENLVTPTSAQALDGTSDAVASTTFEFGKWLGKCTQQDCTEFYLIENSQLFPDVTPTYSGPNSMVYSKSPLSNDKFLLAKQLQGNFPDYLKQRPNQNIGQPNYYDQGGYYVEINENGVLKFWQIDTNLEALPAEIRPWVQQLENVLNQLP